MTSHQKKIILGIIIFIVAFIILTIILKKPSHKATTLEMWGLYDSPQVINALIDSFSKANPNVTIHYTQKDPNSYYNDLINSFANNKAPDIFFLFGNWIPIFQNKIASLDLTKDPNLNLRLINETYPQIVQDDLVNNNSLLGIPLSIDTLALYYNKGIFNYYSIPLPPQTWQEILNLIPKLRKTNPQGQITRAAIALGTSSNIQWSPDILSELMMQLGSSMVDKQNTLVTFNRSLSGNSQIIPGREALKAYIQLADPKSKYYTWPDTFPNDINAFSQGQTTMVIAYHLADQFIKAQSPSLYYGIAKFPIFNLISNPNPVNFGRTMDLVVSNRSASPDIAWQFLKYLSSREASQYYFAQTKNPPSRLDLINLASSDEKVGVFANQILTSKNWYQFDFQQVNSLFSKMINDVVLGNIPAEQAVNTAAAGLELGWQQQIKNQ
jgi:ABC-type glycerol-3-phosphate transport system substrate-binding protein